MQVEVQASMQPDLASAEVASRLEVAGACQELPSGEQLALDMSARLQRHEQCCKSLLHQGQVPTYHISPAGPGDAMLRTYPFAFEPQPFTHYSSMPNTVSGYFIRGLEYGGGVTHGLL